MRALRRRTLWLGGSLGWLLLLGACPPSSPLEQAIDALSDHERREEAIEQLLLAVRQAPKERRAEVKQTVVFALTKAYRADRNRPQLVSALALLKDPRAAEVFVAALGDAERGGAHYEAAVRAARALGELRHRPAVPQLLQRLRRSQGRTNPDRNIWLERSILVALHRIGDRRATPALIAVLGKSPLRQDVFLNKLAVRALGRLADPRAIGPLLDAVGARYHGLLLFPEVRAALCRIGEPVVAPLLARLRRPQTSVRARRGMLVLLPDIASRDRVAAALADRPTGAELGIELERARALFRVQHEAAEPLALSLLQNQQATLTVRRDAATLLGWYGTAQARDAILKLLDGTDGKQPDVLRWTLALALARLAEAEQIDRYDRLIAEETNPATKEAFAVYRKRLALIKRCGSDVGCYRERAGAARAAQRWREEERAILELGRRGATVPRPLFNALAKRHTHVRRALLIALERTAAGGSAGAGVIRELERFARKHPASAEADAAWGLCVARRLARGKGDHR